MEIRKDILGNIPNIGDVIIFNPPKYKGLIYGTCIGFSGVGLPKVGNIVNVCHYLGREYNKCGYYVPLTGFVVSKIKTQ